MKKILSLLFILALFLNMIGCSSKETTNNNSLQNSQISKKELTPDEAKKQLEDKYNTPFNTKNFLTMIKSNDIDKVNLFLKAKVDPNLKDLEDKSWYGKTAIMIAAGLGYKDIVELLIKNGADINAIDDKSRNILWTVIDNDKPNMIKLLVDNKVNIEYIEPKDNANPLYYAFSYNKKVCIKALLEAGANVNVTRKDSSILQLAVFRDADSDIIKMLIDKGANINFQDSVTKYTPLHMAINLNRTETAKILIEAGTDLNIKDKNGFTPLKLAEIWDRNEIINILKSKGAK